MAPKRKIRREDILEAALALIREKGAEALNARALADRLSCSTQPIYSNYPTMELLRRAAVEAAEALFRRAMEAEMERAVYPPYKASGMAYIRFAREEPQLFRLLYMRDRRKEAIPEGAELDRRLEELIRRDTGLDHDLALLLELEMWAYVHGVAVMAATGYLELGEELYSRMLTDAYQGLIHHLKKEESH